MNWKEIHIWATTRLLVMIKEDSQHTKIDYRSGEFSIPDSSFVEDRFLSSLLSNRTKAQEEQTFSLLSQILEIYCPKFHTIYEENESLRSQIAKYSETLAQQTIELYKVKEENQSLQRTISLLESPHTTEEKKAFPYYYDMLVFPKADNALQVEHVLDSLYQLALIKLNRQDYLINCAAALCPVYELIKKHKEINNSVYGYSGGMSVFCDLWNSNVVNRIMLQDEYRANKVTCNYPSFKKEVNNWKNYPPYRWRNMVMNDDSRHKRIFKRAYNIQIQMKKLFEIK